MKNRLFLFFFGIFFSFNVFSIIFSENYQYIKLNKIVNDVPQLLEFFSFYCSHCYQFEEVCHVSKNVEKSLFDKNIKVVRYHVDLFGKIGHELTHAWAVAMALGIEEPMNKMIFEALQKDSSISSYEDIRTIFLNFGVGLEEYDIAWNSCLVKDLVEKQQKAVVDFKVCSVPTLFVNGKYMIINDSLDTSSIHEYIKQFTELVNLLILM